MKIANIFILSFFLLLADVVFTYSYKPNSEPKGFRDMDWGIDISDFSGLAYYDTSYSKGSFPLDNLQDFDQINAINEISYDIFVKAGEELSIEGTEVDNIEYDFLNGKFCEVTITIKSLDRWNAIQKKMFKKFGKGEGGKYSALVNGQEEAFEFYFWAGNTTEMEMHYIESSETGVLWMGSALVREQILKEIEKKQNFNRSLSTGMAI